MKIENSRACAKLPYTRPFLRVKEGFESPSDAAPIFKSFFGKSGLYSYRMTFDELLAQIPAQITVEKNNLGEDVYAGLCLKWKPKLKMWAMKYGTIKSDPLKDEYIGLGHTPIEALRHLIDRRSSI